MTRQSKRQNPIRVTVLKTGEYTIDDLSHLLNTPKRTIRHQIKTIGLEPNGYGVYGELDYLALQGWVWMKGFFKTLEAYTEWLGARPHPDAPRNYDLLPQYVEEAKRKQRSKQRKTRSNHREITALAIA